MCLIASFHFVFALSNTGKQASKPEAVTAGRQASSSSTNDVRHMRTVKGTAKKRFNLGESEKSNSTENFGLAFGFELCHNSAAYFQHVRL